MQGKGRTFESSIYPLMNVFPFGLLSLAIVFDFLALAGAGNGFVTIAYWMVAIGLASGLIMSGLAWLHWTAVPITSRTRSLHRLVCVVHTMVLIFFAGNLSCRYVDPVGTHILAAMFSTLGAGLALLGCCLGRELCPDADPVPASPAASQNLAFVFDPNK